MLFILLYFKSFFYGLSEMQDLPLNAQQYISSFLQEWSISWSRTLAYDHSCLSIPCHYPYFVGLRLNEWLFAFLENVLLVVEHHPYNIIQCSIHIFLLRAVLFTCLRAFEEGTVFCCGHFIYTTDNKLLMERNISCIQISSLFVSFQFFLSIPSFVRIPSLHFTAY